MPIINSLESAAVTALQESGVFFQIFQHQKPIHSLHQAAEERGHLPDQIIRSILFRLSNTDFVMVLIAGEKQISWKALRVYLGERRLTLASPEEVYRQTGYEIGAVTPFGLPQPIRILADPSVFVNKEVSLGSGKKGYALIISPNVIREQFPKLEITPLSE